METRAWRMAPTAVGLQLTNFESRLTRMNEPRCRTSVSTRLGAPEGQRRAFAGDERARRLGGGAAVAICGAEAPSLSSGAPSRRGLITPPCVASVQKLDIPSCGARGGDAIASLVI